MPNIRYQISSHDLVKQMVKSAPTDGSCMEWPRARGKNGYGHVYADGRHSYVHRVAYELAIGPIPVPSEISQTCKNPACFNPAHLRIEKDNLDLLMDLLASSVADEITCLEWPKSRDQHGYGRVYRGTEVGKVHRLSYELAFGPIPEGLDICHRCDNPPCFRPSHLFVGTALDNMQDCKIKDRHSRGVRNGSAKLADEDVILIRTLPALGWTHRRIASRFGVNQATINDVLHRKIWTHI